MEFSLTDEIINQITFAMEDQQHNFLINRKTGEIIRKADEKRSADKEDQEYAAIPGWRPINGYYLMEKFVSSLRNPVFRDRLREALSSGKGVFRSFKDHLKKNKEVENLWFIFKDREMRQIVWRWYDEQRELAGLEKLGPVPEKFEDLALSDFSIKEGDKEHLEPALKLDKKAFSKAFPDADPDQVETVYTQKRKLEPGLLDPKSLLLVIESPMKEFAGFAWGVEKTGPFSEGMLLKIIQVAVVEHYRGLGLGQMLMRRLLQEAHNRGYERLSVELVEASLSLGSFFESLGFKTCSQTLEFDLENWERNLT